ncbi:MAG TPA: StbB family protein [Eoetvoesiella sp.]
MTKIAVVNFSGNVGKSTLTKHLLAPRLPDCEVIPVESINTTNVDGEKVSGKHFKKVIEEMAMHGNVVVDVGSSNIEQAFAQLKNLDDAHEDFDYFVVPCVPDKKQQRDTLELLTRLQEFGVPGSKIKVILNYVSQDEVPESLFPSVLGYCSEMGISWATVYYNEVFELLVGSTVDQAAANLDDVTARIKEIQAKPVDEQDKDELRQLASVRTTARLAKGVKKHFDEIFGALFND